MGNVSMMRTGICNVGVDPKAWTNSRPVVEGVWPKMPPPKHPGHPHHPRAVWAWRNLVCNYLAHDAFHCLKLGIIRMALHPWHKAQAHDDDLQAEE